MKPTKTRISLLLLALTIVLALSACGGNGDTQSGGGNINSENSDAADAPQEDANLYGNSPGNINNGGMATMQGDWIYYCDERDNYKIYKVKPDGSEWQKLNEDSSAFVNVVGNWVYYCNRSDGSKIYRVKTDGTGRQKLNDDYSATVTVVGDWVYYSLSHNDGKYSPGDDYSIHRMKTDGSDRQKLGSHTASFTINVVGDWVYYVNNGIGRVKTDGSVQEKLLDELFESHIIVADDLVYYNNGNDEFSLYRMNADGSNQEKLSRGAAFNVIIDGEWVYYVSASDDYLLCRMKTDRSEKRILTEDQVMGFNTIGELIYYSNAGDGGNIHLMKTNGSGSKSLQGLIASAEERLAEEARLAEEKRIAMEAQADMPKKGEGVTSSSILGKWKLEELDEEMQFPTYYEFLESGVLIITADIPSSYLMAAPARFEHKYSLRGSALTITLVQDGVEDSSTGDIAIADDKMYAIDESGFTLLAMVRVSSGGSGDTAADSAGNKQILGADGDWIYYRNTSDNGFYRVKADGSGTQKLNDEFPKSSTSEINGDWIYQTHATDRGGHGSRIYRVNINGGDRQRVTEDFTRSSTFIIVGDWIYYAIIDSNGYPENLCKIKTDGTGREELTDKGVSSFVVADGWIYYNYLDYSKQSYSFWKMKSDGSGKQQISSQGIMPTTSGNDHFKVVGDWVYYSDGRGVHKMKTDGSGGQKLNDTIPYSIFVEGDWIYCWSYGGAEYKDKIYRVKTDGSEEQILADDISSVKFIERGRIYYTQMAGNERIEYSMKLDGSDKQPW